MSFPFNVEKWRVWFGRVEGSDPAPIERVLRWVQIESGGNVCAVGRVDNGHIYEAGLAQTYFSAPASVVHGVTVRELRADCDGTTMPTDLTDERRLLHVQVALDTVKEHRARARRRLASNGMKLDERTNAFWCWVKLVHAAPAMFDFLPACIRAQGASPSWGAFWAWFRALDYAQRAAINKGIADRVARKPAPGEDDYLTRVIRNCEHFAGDPGGSAGSGGGSGSLLKLGAFFASLLALFGLSKRGGNVASS